MTILFFTAPNSVEFSPLTTPSICLLVHLSFCLCGPDVWRWQYVLFLYNKGPCHLFCFVLHDVKAAVDLFTLHRWTKTDQQKGICFCFVGHYVQCNEQIVIYSRKCVNSHFWEMHMCYSANKKTCTGECQLFWVYCFFIHLSNVYLIK